MLKVLVLLAYLAIAFALCWVGKLAYGLLHPRTRVDREVLARDNAAFAVPLAAYYLGILFVMGGPLSGASQGSFPRDAASVAGWGLLAVVLLNLALAADRFLEFRRLDLAGEIFEKKNLAAGIVVAGGTMANALVILGAMTGEGGALPVIVFWLYGEALLTLLTLALPPLMGFDLEREIRRGNQAVALAFAGSLVALGNIIRMGIMGTFYGWASGLFAATAYAAGGFLLLVAVRQVADWVLLPGVTIRQELVTEKNPNAGVGFMIGLLSLGASFLVGWTL